MKDVTYWTICYIGAVQSELELCAVEKRYNYRIYPNKEQEEQIQRNFGCVRFIYNYYLAKRIEKYESGEGMYRFYDACKDLTELKRTEGYEWLRKADAHSLQNAIKNMDNAYTAFFRRVREKNGAPGFPCFKSKKETRQSYTSQAQTGKNVIYFTDKEIRLPKLGLVKCSVSRQIQGRILSATVTQVPSGKYYVSICFTGPGAEQLPQTGKRVGLHFGVKTLAVSSDGRVYENHRFLEKSQKKISRLQKRMSRKPSDSTNREKARIALAKAHERVKNQRADAMQKLTTQLVREYDVICVRDDKLREMKRHRQYSYFLSDASWGEFIRLLKYKCEWYGKQLVEIDPSYPSVQLCSSCGHKNTEVAKKRLPIWTCPNCSAKHDRAKNAAKNTLAEGLRILVES